MNAGLPPINLADAFGPQARTDQLAGLLPPKTPTVTSSPKKATPPPADETPTTRERTARRAPTTPKAKVGRARGVIVYVTVSQREWLRTHISTDRTVTDVVLDALEAHVHTLAPPTPTSTKGLFTRSTRPTPHNGVQVQLRLTPANLDVLDQLVRERNFPSRSALIRAALAAAEQA